MYKLAAEGGDEEAKYNLAYHYENGVGCDVDVKKAIQLYNEVVEMNGSCKMDAQASLDELNSADAKSTKKRTREMMAADEEQQQKKKDRTQ